MPPTHELPIIVTENGLKSIYCVAITLTQADLGYEPPAAGQPRGVAPNDLAVYADTVVLKDPLVLPGRNLRIVARAIVAGPGASIDVSGASADSSFAPGDLPRQQDLAAGAPGSAGAAATAGGAAGNLTLVAECVSGPGTSGSAAIHLVNLARDLRDGITPACTGAIAAPVAPFGLPFGYFHFPFGNQPPNPYPFEAIQGQLQFDAFTLQGHDPWLIDACWPSADGSSATLLLSARYAGATVAPMLTLQSIDKPASLTGTKAAIPLAMSACSLQISVTVRADAQWQLGTAELTCSFTTPPVFSQTPALAGDLGPVGAAVADFVNQSRDTVLAPVSNALIAALRPIVDGVVQAMDARAGAAPPHLVLLARGHIGGRGQDGHPGVKGSRGDDGRPTSTEVWADARGGAAAPPETWGKQGCKGGKAGSAGTSGTGGKGGVISVSFVKPSPVNIVTCVGGGAGGDPAAPGVRGVGGDGGDGAGFVVHELSLQGNYVHNETGPGGPTGAEGDPADFAGARGANGDDGRVTVNAAAFAGGVPATFSYEQMAPELQLDQLLMVQREGKLGYLNATGAADYARAATFFLWLCDASPQAATVAGATNRLAPEDRAARAAIRAAAQVELLRLQRGLDFFGHPYNWAPILRLSHLQKRTTELVTLGGLVEQQYEHYLDANKSVAEKLAALDQTLQALSSDLDNNLAAETALQQQIALAEGAMASLQTDIEHQVAVLKRDQVALDLEIKRQIADTCKLENIIKIISAVVAIGAGAVNGISEIAGAAELEAIVAQAKAAAAAAGQAKAAIDEVRQGAATLQGLADTLLAVDGAIAADKPDAVKIVVARQDFEENIKPLIEKFPGQAKELRAAARAFFDLAQARNEKVLAYNALFVQKAALATHRQQIAAQVSAVNAIRSSAHGALVPASYLSFFKSALVWSKQNLIDLLYEQVRAFHYHAGTPMSALLDKVSDLNIGALADTQSRLLMAYDNFLTTVGRPWGPLDDIRFTVSKADLPAAFDGLSTTGRLTFVLPPTAPAFAGLTLVKVDAVAVRLPGVVGSASDELNVALMMMGEGAVRPVDQHDDASLQRFNCPPRPISFRASIDPDRRDPIVEPGLIADDDFCPLSPFTTWTLDFGLPGKLNAFVDLAKLDTIELRFSGHAFGRLATVIPPSTRMRATG